MDVQEGERLALSGADDTQVRLTRVVALAFGDADLRARVLADMRNAPFKEHKLELSQYIKGQNGGILWAKIRERAGLSDSEIKALLEGTRPLEFYMPVTSQRNLCGLTTIFVLATICPALGQSDSQWSVGPMLGYEIQSNGPYVGAHVHSIREPERSGFGGIRYEAGVAFSRSELHSVLFYFDSPWFEYRQKDGGLSFLAAPFGVGGVLRDSPENDAFALGASATLQYAMRKGTRAFFGIRYMRATASPENLGLLALGLSIPF